MLLVSSRISANAAILVEIARRGSERPEQCAVVRKAPCDKMHNFAIAFDHAFDAHQAGMQKLGALAIDQVFPHHDIHAAGLVLERDKYHAACRIRTLPAGDESGYAGGAAMRKA